MTKQSSSGTTTHSKTGVLSEIGRNAQLVWNLFTDRRVSLLTKLVIPGLMAGYLLWPVDLLPDVIPVIGQLDDLAILALGIKLFIELCPKDVVQGYRSGASGTTSAPQTDDGDAVDADYRVIK